jgi:hypothetical protein
MMLRCIPEVERNGAALAASRVREERTREQPRAVAGREDRVERVLQLRRPGVVERQARVPDHDGEQAVDRT